MKYLQIILAIATNTHREIIRDRIWFSLVIFACLISVFAIILGNLSLGQDMRLLLDIGMSAICLMTGFIAIFAGANLVYKELERRTVYVIFTKPVAGAQFIFGKYLGLCLAMFDMVAGMGIFLLALIFFFHPAAATNEFALKFAAALGLIYLEIAFITALATFFSAFANPVLSVIFSLSLWFTAHLTSSIHDLAKLCQTAFTARILDAIYWLLPDFSGLTSARFMLMNGEGQTSEVILYSTCYVVAYVLILLFLAATITERKEFA